MAQPANSARNMKKPRTNNQPKWRVIKDGYSCFELKFSIAPAIRKE